MDKPLEILAPAGSPEALEAAVRCGADAVYLGASAFHARRNSPSFSDEDLPQVVAYCHSRGTAVHLTLNTLIREEELDRALSIAETACASGVDALIVQDLGLARRIHACAPELTLHASTQLSCHTPEGVRFLRRIGFSRVVLAREMTAGEIAACAGQGCELEMFVHGALCMCVSGQCYFSAMLGGRSGNRGLCAQPCRLPFRPDGSRDTRMAALSLKDMCLLPHMTDLPGLGVASLKIEGRMKRPEYVAAAVTVYRAAARGETPDPQTVADLQAVFSRSGFTDGYFQANRNDMFGTRRKEDVEAAPPVLRRLQRLYAAETPRIPVEMTLTVAAGEPVGLRIDDREGHTARVVGNPPEKAVSRPLDPQRAAAQLRKTGGTPFVADPIAVDVSRGLTMPLSAINSLRREALDSLLAERAHRPVIGWNDVACPALGRASTPPPVPRLMAQFSREAQVPPHGGDADTLVLPLFTPVERLAYWQGQKPTAIAIPRGLFGRSKAVRQRLDQVKKAGITEALCGTMDGVALALQAGLRPMGGPTLNLTNAQALAACADSGMAGAVLSMELTFNQMAFAEAAPIETGLLVYGRQPLMLTRNCPRTGGALCGRQACGGFLTDRKGKNFPLQCDGVCVELLNADRLYWADRLGEIPRTGFWLLSFTDETTAEAADVIRRYRAGGPPREGITRGLYRRGVE